MAQLLNSRSLTERPRDAAETAAGQADLVDEARRLGLEVDEEIVAGPDFLAYGVPAGSYDVVVEGGVEGIVGLAKWARGRGVELAQVLGDYDEDLELAQRELGYDVGVARL